MLTLSIEVINKNQYTSGITDYIDLLFFVVNCLLKI